MKKGIVRVEIFSPRSSGCQPDLTRHFFSLDENGNDRLFTEKEYHNLFSSYLYPFIDGAYLHEFKVDGYDCYTKYVFIKQIK